MKTKTRMLVSATIALAAGCLIASCSRQATAPAHEVKLGVAGALSGGVAFWGESILHGMQLATEEYNAVHPGAPARIIFEDNAGEAKNQLAAMRKLCTVDHVSSVVSILTPYSKPLRPLAKEFQTPVLGAVVASLNFGAENEWSFRDYPTPDQLCGTIADYAYNKRGFRKAVALVVNDEYGTDSAKIFKQSFEKLGGHPVESDTVTQADTDMRAQITKLLQQSPDCVFLAIRENALGTAVRQFRELGFKGQFLGINAFDSPVVWQACGPYGDGIIFSSVLIDYAGNVEAASFAKAFLKRFGKAPNNTNAYGYSMAKYLLPMAAQSGSDGNKMRSLLSALDGDSLRGHIKMQPNRDVLTGVAIYQRKGDKDAIISN